MEPAVPVASIMTHAVAYRHAGWRSLGAPEKVFSCSCATAQLLSKLRGGAEHRNRDKGPRPREKTERRFSLGPVPKVKSVNRSTPPSVYGWCNAAQPPWSSCDFASRRTVMRAGQPLPFSADRVYEDASFLHRRANRV